MQVMDVKRAPIFLTLLLAWLFAAGVAQAETRVALIIGNSAYAHAPPLANPANDAADMAGALRRLGFSQVDVVRDASLPQMRAALQNFQRTAAGADVAIIFFAGHGIAVDGVTRLVPTDARLETAGDVDFETIPADLVLRAVSGAKRLKLVVLDACRNNPFASRMIPVAGQTRSISRGLGRIEPGSDTLVWYAARDGTTAADGRGRNSPFTTALLKHIAQPGLELDKFTRTVRDDVLAATGNIQEPFVYGSRGREDFFFVPQQQQVASREPSTPVTAPPAVTQTPALAAPSPAMVREVQAMLNDLGYEPGRPDGVAGQRTVQALRTFQASAGLPATGVIDETTVMVLRATARSSGTTVAATAAPPVAAPPLAAQRRQNPSPFPAAPSAAAQTPLVPRIAADPPAATETARIAGPGAHFLITAVSDPRNCRWDFGTVRIAFAGTDASFREEARQGTASMQVYGKLEDGEIHVWAGIKPSIQGFYSDVAEPMVLPARNGAQSSMRLTYRADCAMELAVRVDVE